MLRTSAKGMKLSRCRTLQPGGAGRSRVFERIRLTVAWNSAASKGENPEAKWYARKVRLWRESFGGSDAKETDDR